jgi:hypothetical protein
MKLVYMYIYLEMFAEGFSERGNLRAGLGESVNVVVSFTKSDYYSGCHCAPITTSIMWWSVYSYSYHKCLHNFSQCVMSSSLIFSMNNCTTGSQNCHYILSQKTINDNNLYLTATLFPLSHQQVGSECINLRITASCIQLHGYCLRRIVLNPSLVILIY